MKRIILLTLLIAMHCASFGQMTSPAAPATRPEGRLRSTQAMNYLTLPVDRQASGDSSLRRCHVGNVCTLNWDIKAMGESFVTDAGTRVWCLGICSEGAQAIGLMMRSFHLPKGACLLLYSPNRNVLHGGYGADNNAPDSLLAIAPFPGDSVIVEYQEPDNADFEGSVVIGEASHNFRSINSFGRSTAVCNPHVSTQEELQMVQRGVMDLYVYGMSGGRQAWACTAWMPANQAGKPYLYTAYHCLNDNLSPEQLARRSVVYFNYEVPAQDTTTQGSIEQTMSGLRYVAGFDSLDFALTEFMQEPPRDYRPYQLGWTRNAHPGGDLTCIQHPFGDSKRVSYSQSEPVHITLTEQAYSPCYIENGYWHVGRWNKGTTEAGSSGSPLMNADLLVFGGLTGGNSTCDSPRNDYFSRLDLAWDYRPESGKQVKCWLASDNSDIVSMPGKEYYEKPCMRTSHIGRQDSIASTRLDPPEVGWLTGHNSLDHEVFAERFVFDEPQTLYGVFLLPACGVYYPPNPVFINIYDGVDKPEELRYRQQIFPHDISSFDAQADTFRTSTRLRWKNTEIYVRLGEKLFMDSVFFVGYEISYDNLTPSDSFAVRNLGSVAAQNTAWLLDGDTWIPFSEHPLRPVATSLWMDVITLNGRPTAIRETTASHASRLHLWPNPSRGMIHWDEDAPAYRLTDLQGHLLQSGSGRQALLPDTPGCYLIHLRLEDGWETHKIIRLP